jgi:glutamate-ammonia-ligase adenylyltransferase
MTMTSFDPNKLTTLLLAAPAQPDELAGMLSAVGFANAAAAASSLRRLAAEHPPAPPFAKGDVDPRFVLNLVQQLSTAAHPDRALISFERFVQNCESPAALYKTLTAEPRTLEILILIFAGSQYLTEILLRHPQDLDQLRDQKKLTHAKNRLQFYREAMDAADATSAYEDKLNCLRIYQKRELLRIGACDLIGLGGFQFITTQLSQLANGLIQTALDIVSAELGLKSAGFAVLALGKLGGRELNYSSDIDLLFLAKSADEVHQRLGQKLIDALNRPTVEGFLYRVDMRLRPWGRGGKLAPGLSEHLSYLKTSGRAWEKQALLKSRLIAGDELIGLDFLQEVRPLIFDQSPDEVREAIRSAKSEIEKGLKKKGKDWGEVKSGKGSIRDVEFATQYLQLVHGSQHPEIRSRNTLDGLARLLAANILSANDYRVLADGYTFLRTVEHHLQIMNNQQTHQLPTDQRELSYLARRMGFEGDDLHRLFVERYQQHSAAIRAVYQRLVETASTTESPKTVARPAVADNLLSQMDASYTSLFGEDQIRRHVEMAERLSEKNLVEVEVNEVGPQKWQITIVGYDYVGELSLICGLLFVYGFNIEDGQIFSYEPSPEPSNRKRATHTSFQRRRTIARKSRRRIVDVLTVTSSNENVASQLRNDYRRELSELVAQLQAKQHRDVQGKLAKRVAMAIGSKQVRPEALLPVEIDIDNTGSKDYTVIRIDAPDTIGFLYELTNALALNGVNIGRVAVTSIGNRVHDTLFVTNLSGNKIIDAEQQQQLRAATVLVKHFTHLLPNMPNPESALLHFHEFVAQLFEREDWAKEIASIERPDVLEALARLLGVSDFLWEDFLRMQHANLFPVVENVQSLDQAKTKSQLQRELWTKLENVEEAQLQRDILNAFKDREMFRIDMRFIQKLIPEFWLFSSELTHLGEVVVETAYQLNCQNLTKQYGAPRLDDGRPCAMSVCALGKFGGREIGFASDIELMFFYEGGGTTSGPQSITNAELVAKLAQEVRQSIRAKRAGIFEIDLRLRPYGKSSSLGVTLDAFRRYFSADGPAWNYERQTLVKLRPIAGDPDFGRRIVALRDECVYGGSASATFDVGAMRALRERQVRQLVKGGTVNAKFSPGALVDVEYLIQALQIMHGYAHPELRATNTTDALTGLIRTGILSTQNYVKLRDALDFLRDIIQGLRVVRGNAKDLTVPALGTDEFSYLARRLGYEPDHARLLDDLNKHTGIVQDLSQQVLG